MSSYKQVIAKMLMGEYNHLELLRQAEAFNLALARVPKVRLIPYDPMIMAH